MPSSQQKIKKTNTNSPQTSTGKSKESTNSNSKSDTNLSIQESDDKFLYSRLPSDLLPSGSKTENPKYVESFVKDTLKLGGKLNNFDYDKLQNQVIMLDNPKPIKTLEEIREKKMNKKLKSRRVLKSKEKRDKKIFEVPPSSQKYSLFIPLHNLWTQYIDDAIGNATGPMLESRLLKADFHGCIITVTKSKCPDYIGITGIVTQETTNTFKLITKENKIKTIPKANTIFQFKLGSLPQLITLYGNHFCFRPYDRTSRKFKHKSTIEL